MLRSSLHPEEQPNRVKGPTKYRGGPNQSELTCSSCNEMYFVDDVSFRQAMSAMEKGLENPFCCDECEAEQEELAH
jgi:hypothetical protein